MLKAVSRWKENMIEEALLLREFIETYPRFLGAPGRDMTDAEMRTFDLAFSAWMDGQI